MEEPRGDFSCDDCDFAAFTEHKLRDHLTDTGHKGRPWWGELWKLLAFPLVVPFAIFGIIYYPAGVALQLFALIGRLALEIVALVFYPLFWAGNRFFQRRSIKPYEEAVRRDSLDATTYINRGVAHAEQDRYQQAIRDYDEAIRLNPQFQNAYANRALAYTHLDEGVIAQLNVERAVKLGVDRTSLERDLDRRARFRGDYW